MALLTVTQNELELLQFALAISNNAILINDPSFESKSIAALAKKVNTALVDIQKDIEFERQYSGVRDLLDIAENLK
jgi:hypothetical protein